MQKHRCSERVYEDRWHHQCTRSGVVERGGKWYCRQHDPVAVKARREARCAKWESEWAERLARQAKGAALQAAKDRVIEAAKAFERIANGIPDDWLGKMTLLIEQFGNGHRIKSGSPETDFPKIDDYRQLRAALNELEKANEKDT